MSDLEQMLKLLAILAEAGIEVKMASHNRYLIDGFYKSGGALVNLDERTITTRYGTNTKFNGPDDFLEVMIQLNLYWWQRSRDRLNEWTEIDSNWQKIVAHIITT